MNSHINFLEKKGFNFKRIEFNYFFIFLTCGLVLFFMIAYGGIQKIRLDKLQNRLAAKLSQVKASQASQGLKQPSVAGEGHASTSSFSPEKRIAWAPVLNLISAKTEGVVWMQSLSGLTESKTLEIEGEGTGFEAVSRFNKGLEAMDPFQKVSLLSSERATSGNIVFKIRGTLK